MLYIHIILTRLGSRSVVAPLKLVVTVKNDDDNKKTNNDNIYNDNDNANSYNNNDDTNNNSFIKNN